MIVMILQAAVIVEAFRNICGLSYIANYSEYNEFNLRKYQTSVLTPAQEENVTEEEKQCTDV